MEVRQFERAVRDAEGKLAQVSTACMTKHYLMMFIIVFRLLSHSISLLLYSIKTLPMELKRKTINKYTTMFIILTLVDFQ